VRHSACLRRCADRRNKPVVDSLVGQIHFAHPAARAVAAPGFPHCRLPRRRATAAAVYIVRTRGMPNASACGPAWRVSRAPAGTPCPASEAGWSYSRQSRRRRRRGLPSQHARRLLRLIGVAHRFERIGREAAARPRRRARACRAHCDILPAHACPTLANAVTITVESRPVKVRLMPCCSSGQWKCWSRMRSTRSPVAAVHHAGNHATARRWRAHSGVRRGPGIPREIRKRVSSPALDEEERMGIGLSLARRIVEENHGGECACPH